MKKTTKILVTASAVVLMTGTIAKANGDWMLPLLWGWAVDIAYPMLNDHEARIDQIEQVSTQSFYLVDANGLQVGDYPPLVGVAGDSGGRIDVALFTSDTGVVSVDVDSYFESLKNSALLFDPWTYSSRFFTSDCTGTEYLSEKNGEHLGVPVGFVEDNQLYRMDYQEITYDINAINGLAGSITYYGGTIYRAQVPMYRKNIFSESPSCDEADGDFRYDPNTGFVTLYTVSPTYVKDVPTFEGPLRLEMR